MITITTYGTSPTACPSGACECWFAKNSELRLTLTQDQHQCTAARHLTQLTCRWISNIFGEAGDETITAERAQSLLEYVTNLSGGTVPRIIRSWGINPEIVYFLNTRKYSNVAVKNHGLKELPVLPGVCRNGPFKSINRILLHAYNSGMIQLESTVMENVEDFA